KIGYSKVLFLGLIGGGIGNLLQFFVNNLFIFGLLRFGYGLFFAAVYPSINAMIVKVTEPEFRGRAFGLNQSTTQLATMLGPVLGGFLGGWIPIQYVFILNGIGLIATALLIKAKRMEEMPLPSPSLKA
ncbi:MAG: MFS transporter, partial [Clostridia bacterium]